MTFNSMDNIFETFKPIYYFSKIFGILPITVDFTKRNVKTTIADLIKAFGCVCVWIVIFISWKLNGAYDEKAEKIVLNTGVNVALSFGFFIVISLPIFNVLNRVKLTKIIFNLSAFDERVRKLLLNLIVKIPSSCCSFYF